VGGGTHQLLHAECAQYLLEHTSSLLITFVSIVKLLFRSLLMADISLRFSSFAERSSRVVQPELVLLKALSMHGQNLHY
jgi:hypothetical protein